MTTPCYAERFTQKGISTLTTIVFEDISSGETTTTTYWNGESRLFIGFVLIHEVFLVRSSLYLLL